MAQDQKQTPVITTTPAFAVHRRKLVLVGPAGPTPRETKRLSDIDDQEMLRGHVPLLFVYRGGVAIVRVPPTAATRRPPSAALSARRWSRTTRSPGGCGRWRDGSWSSTAPARG